MKCEHTKDWNKTPIFINSDRKEVICCQHYSEITPKNKFINHFEKIESLLNEAEKQSRMFEIYFIQAKSRLKINSLVFA